MRSAARYSKVAIVLHWAIALLILGLIGFGFLMTQEWMPQRFVIYQWHKSFGITVLVLSCFRLIWRLTHRPPGRPFTRSEPSLSCFYLSCMLAGH